MKRHIATALYALLVCAMLLAGACTPKSQPDDPTLYVSIQPLRSLVSGIVGDDFEIRVLVPPGASPETFELTPRQFVELNRSRMIFSVGLIDFENSLLERLDDRHKIVNLSRGIELLAGSCPHGHGHGHAPAAAPEGHSPASGGCNDHEADIVADHGGEAHRHGVDPHLWISPKRLLQMADNAYEAIRTAYPDSTRYAANYGRLRARLEELDRRTTEKIARSRVKELFVYHPVLTYYGHDYGLEQVAIEEDGKEPSARSLARLIDRARRNGIRKILYQSQFPASSVEVIARDVQAQSVEIDPLKEDVIANIDSITDLIVSE